MATKHGKLNKQPRVVAITAHMVTEATNMVRALLATHLSDIRWGRVRVAALKRTRKVSIRARCGSSSRL
jgi:hypothetical protein